MVAVLEQVERLADAAGAEVDRHHRLDAGRSRPAHELVEADLVGLVECQARSSRVGAVIARTDAVLPAVARDEVAARVAHDRDAELADQLDHVGAEAVRVGARVAGLVDAGVDAAAQVLDERAEQPRADRGDDVLQVDARLRREHHACA